MDKYLVVLIPLYLLAISTFVELYLWWSIINKHFKLYLGFIGVFFLVGAVYFSIPNTYTYYLMSVFGVSTIMYKVFIFYKSRYRVGKKYGNAIIKDVYTIMGMLNSEMKQSTPVRGAADYEQFIHNFTVNANGLLVVGYDGTFKYVNNTFCKYLGKDREWFMKKNVIDLILLGEQRRSIEVWENNKAESNMQDFINYWVIEGKEYKMHWILLWNDNEKQISYCVLKVM